MVVSVLTEVKAKVEGKPTVDLLFIGNRLWLELYWKWLDFHCRIPMQEQSSAAEVCTIASRYVRTYCQRAAIPCFRTVLFDRETGKEVLTSEPIRYENALRLAEANYANYRCEIVCDIPEKE